METSLNVLEINMNVREVQCSLCGEWCEHRWGVPTFNGDLVSNDFPDWLCRTGGGGQPVCEQCFESHAKGDFPVWDCHYQHLANVGTVADGEGI